MQQKTKEYDRQKVRLLFFFIRRCLEVARGAGRKTMRVLSPVSAPPCGAFSNAPTSGFQATGLIYRPLFRALAKHSYAMGCRADATTARIYGARNYVGEIESEHAACCRMRTLSLLFVKSKTAHSASSELIIQHMWILRKFGGVARCGPIPSACTSARVFSLLQYAGKTGPSRILCVSEVQVARASFVARKA